MPSKNRSLVRPEWVFIFSLVLSFNVGLASAEDFDRFMTTAKERKHLDKLREAKTDLLIVPDETELEISALAEPTKVYLGTITAKGLVYRSKGKSTAWINNSNSYEGDAASNYVNIAGENIQPDRMSIALPGQANKIQLKVGQTFDRETGQLKDITGNALSSAPGSEHIPVNE